MSSVRIPRVVVKPSQLTGFSLSPLEGFVLSRIDGSATDADIAMMTSLSEVEIRAILERLRSLNVIRFSGEPDPPPSGEAAKGAVRSTPPQQEPVRTKSGSFAATKLPFESRHSSVRPDPRKSNPAQAKPSSPSHNAVIPVAPPTPVIHQAAPGAERSPSSGSSVKVASPQPPPASPAMHAPQPATPSASSAQAARPPERKPSQTNLTAVKADSSPVPGDEKVDLDADLRRRIRDTYERLGSMNHYEVLGLRQAADRREIKSAYFDLAAVFHPDRYFRRELGAYKEKMEVIFTRVTQAHDVLTSKGRADYDATLAEEAPTTPGFSSPKVPPKPSPSQAFLSAVSILKSASKEAEAGPRSEPPEKRAALDADARKEMLSKKLRSSVIPGRMSSAPPPPVVVPTDGLKHRYESMKVEAAKIRARPHLQAAEEAIKKGDVKIAKNEIAKARELNPLDPTIATLYDKLFQS